MSVPTIASAPIVPLKGELSEDNHYTITIPETVTFRFSVLSSGNGTPTVKLTVDWGDGLIDSEPNTVVGRQVQFSHAYDLLGEYEVEIHATNSSGETTIIDPIAPYNLIKLRMVERPFASKPLPYRWSGLALPGRTIDESVTSVDEIFPPFFTKLTTATTVGSPIIFVVGEEQFDTNAHVILSQDGKLFTTGRVMSRDGNQVQLDADANDVYDPALATIELRRESLIRQRAERQTPPDNWHFPSTLDQELVRASVRMILSTRRGERLYRSGFGSNLHRIVFDQNDSLAIDRVRYEVADAIAREESRINLVRVTLTAEGEQINCHCVLTMRDGSEAFELNFSL